MKLLSFQPASLYVNGGCGRLLRRLFQGNESNITAVFVKMEAAIRRDGEIKEYCISSIPIHQKWMRWKFRNLSRYLREHLFYKMTARKLENLIGTINYDILHIVNHGIWCEIFVNKNFATKPFWASFHDHYSLCSSFSTCRYLWINAQRRLVISRELGNEYQNLFGNRDFEIITDGVKAEEISTPLQNLKSPYIIYFSGLLHVDYYPLFRVLADALDEIVSEGFTFKLVIRGSEPIDFLEKRSFDLEFKQDFISDEAIKEEIDSASFLYLPIKFSTPEFYLYSLSTKMVGYLGAKGAILFHGPEDSAACRMLASHHAAIICASLEVNKMIAILKENLGNTLAISTNAKKLAREKFSLVEMQNKFWEKNKNNGKGSG
jgi:hypothetical protein